MKTILDLNAIEARKFFLKEESYCNFPLPSYFCFEGVLEMISRETNGKSVSYYFSSKKKPKDCEGVNYQLIGNKDGRYAWRPFQLIHPVLYIQLVDIITNEDNWAVIVQRLRYLEYQSKNIACVSMPAVSLRYKKDRAELISRWSLQVEKESIFSSLDFDYIFHTDISDCYSSIYTHSIAWALHDKDVAKSSIRDKNLIGNKIDSCIQSMSYGQTNGIPQGSVLMDFVAEIVLSYIDSLLSEKIGGLKIKKRDYKIIRYRDDYRVFSNNPQVAETIIKELTDILYEFGMKLNSGKTAGFSDVIHASLKPDKLHVMTLWSDKENLTEELYTISVFSKKYPNSGQLDSLLRRFFERIKDLNKKEIKNIRVLLSVVVDIAYKNPRVYPITSAILSKLISLLSKTEEHRVVRKILKKFEKIPNTGIMQIWLQRISLAVSWEYSFTEKVCQKVDAANLSLWNSEWINERLKNKVDTFDIVNRKEVEKLAPVVSDEEIELFGLQEAYI